MSAKARSSQDQIGELYHEIQAEREQQNLERELACREQCAACHREFPVAGFALEHPAASINVTT
jgi:hypothetical protein